MTPTAHRPPPGMAVIAAKPLSDPAVKLGLGTKDHTPLIPCNTSGSWLSVDGSMSQPTAHIEPSAAEVTAISLATSCCRNLLGSMHSRESTAILRTRALRKQSLPLADHSESPYDVAVLFPQERENWRTQDISED